LQGPEENSGLSGRGEVGNGIVVEAAAEREREATRGAERELNAKADMVERRAERASIVLWE